MQSFGTNFRSCHSNGPSLVMLEIIVQVEGTQNNYEDIRVNFNIETLCYEVSCKYLDMNVLASIPQQDIISKNFTKIEECFQLASAGKFL